jgi:hypothetical protein
VSDFLSSVHLMAAGFFGMPELLLNDEEAEKLGGSIERVLALYKTEVNPAVMAWMNMGFTITCVYGTRVWAIRARMKAEEAAAAAAGATAPGNVVEMRPPAKPASAAASSEWTAARPPAAPGGGAAAPAAPAPGGPMGTPTDLFGPGYSAALQESV